MKPIYQQPFSKVIRCGRAKVFGKKESIEIGGSLEI